MMKRLILLVVVILNAQKLMAQENKIFLPAIFSDNMVLQRNTEAAFRGNFVFMRIKAYI